MDSPTASLPANFDLGNSTEDTETDTLVRASSFPAASLNQQRRRRGGGNTSRFAARQQSFSREIGHAAAETYLLTRLTFMLLRYLGVGYRWITRLLALVLYAMFLMPGFLQVGFHYFFSSNVRRSIVYGDQPRNRLDLYVPTNSDDLKPVLIFVTGGAWIIGYKAWGSLLGLHLAENDIIVACLDYRNFPQGTISDMVSDVCQGIAFIFHNIVELGGDPNKCPRRHALDGNPNQGLLSGWQPNQGPHPWWQPKSRSTSGVATPLGPTSEVATLGPHIG